MEKTSYSYDSQEDIFNLCEETLDDLNVIVNYFINVTNLVPENEVYQATTKERAISDIYYLYVGFMHAISHSEPKYDQKPTAEEMAKKLDITYEAADKILHMICHALDNRQNLPTNDTNASITSDTNYNLDNLDEAVLNDILYFFMKMTSMTEPARSNYGKEQTINIIEQHIKALRQFAATGGLGPKDENVPTDVYVRVFGICQTAADKIAEITADIKQ